MSDRDSFPSERQERFIVRLPDGMRDRIRSAAEANGRSMNAEIVATLLEKYPPEADPDLEALIEKAMKVAPGELERILKGIVDRQLASGEITEQDIEDGLVPGFSLRRPSDD